MNVKYLILDLLRSKTISNFITKRVINDFFKFNDSHFCVIGTENANYFIDDLLFIIQQTLKEYSYTDIRDSDIVLDVGACNGGFSLEVHKKVRHVYAVEPLFCPELERHIRLNNAQNITPLKYALGKSGVKKTIVFNGRRETVECKTLSDLIDLCGGYVDVLKIDCEGGEWNIKPHELKNIRRIEAEIHSFNNERLLDFLDMLKSVDFVVAEKRKGKTTMLLSAKSANTRIKGAKSSSDKSL